MGILAIFGTSVLIPGVIVSAAENTSQEAQSSESVPSITINVNGVNQTIPDVEIENSTAG